jgi:hypothetical protein
MLDLTSLVSFFILGIIGWITYKIYIWPVYITPLRKIPGPPSENLFYGNFKTILTEEVNNIIIKLVIMILFYTIFFLFIYIAYAL